MVKRSFFEGYLQDTQGQAKQRDRPALIRRGAWAAVWGFIHKLFSAVFHVAVSVLSLIGLSVLAYAPLREILIALVYDTVTGYIGRW